MILGGLEIVAGGYLIHRHYRKKDQQEKNRLEHEAHRRRHNNLHGAHDVRPGWNTQTQYPPQHDPQAAGMYKYAYYTSTATAAPQEYQYQYQYQHQPQTQQPFRPQPPAHHQSFTVPRTPLSQLNPEVIYPNSLRRQESVSSVSHMPMANGRRPPDVREYAGPASLHPQISGDLQPPFGVYGNAAFSASTPAFGATVTSPSVSYVVATREHADGRHTVDDNWKPYAHGGGRPHYAPSVSTDLGEHDLPPPYVP